MAVLSRRIGKLEDRNGDKRGVMDDAPAVEYVRKTKALRAGTMSAIDASEFYHGTILRDARALPAWAEEELALPDAPPSEFELELMRLAAALK